MKRTLLITLIAGAAAAFSATASAQDFIRPVRPVPGVSRPPEAPRIIREGGINRGIRKGNPLQMVNPLASRDYGTGAEFVEYRDNDPFLRPPSPEREHPIALRLFAFEF